MWVLEGRGGFLYDSSHFLGTLPNWPAMDTRLRRQSFTSFRCTAWTAAENEAKAFKEGQPDKLHH